MAVLLEGGMPFELTNQGTHFLLVAHGKVTPQDLSRLADDMDAIEDASPEALDRIADLTQITEFDIGFTEMRALAVRRRIRTFERNVRTAIIANTELQVGMARMFQAMNDNPQIEIRIVGSMAMAREWIRLPAEA